MVDHTGVWVKADLRTGGEGGGEEEKGAFWDPWFRFLNKSYRDWSFQISKCIIVCEW